MLHNYIKIFYRNMIRQKSYALINLIGLSLGITCCILILAFIGYELSFDAYHKNADNILRIVSVQTDISSSSEMALALAPVGPTLVQDYPEVLDAVRISPTVKRVFTYQDKSFFQEGVLYVDKSIFNVFSFELVKGNPDTALEVPFTMVITQTTAQKIFGEEDPVGKVVNWDNRFDYRITGVVQDPPDNSHFTFHVLASFSTFIKYDARIGSWQGGSFRTYLLLKNKTDPAQFERKMAGFNEKYLAPILKDTGTRVATYLQPLKSIHLKSHVQSELGVNSDIKVIYVFSAIAVVILLIACINFMNLSTARSARRAKEVGLRKVLGAERKKLIHQFFSEAFIFALISLVLAVVLSRLLLPAFRVLTSRNISLSGLDMPYIYAGLFGIVLFVGLVAGSYPAFFLSSFHPISALRGGLQQGPKGSRFRSLLVIFQFSISIVLIVCTLVIYSQQKYMKNKDVGFDKNDLLIVALQNQDVRLGLESFKQEILKMKEVVNAGTSSMVPGEMYLFNIGAYPEGLSKEQMFRMDNFLVDDGFLDTFKIEVVKGRGFSRLISTDLTDAVMINETAARTLEWENPIGKSIEILASRDGQTALKIVIGVFRDIHQRSLYSVVAPTVIQYISDVGAIELRGRRLAFRLNTDDLAGTLSEIQNKWEATYPNNPYYSFFLDEFFDSQHRAEEKLGNIFRTFAVMAVFIGCIGLFGLASFVAEQRTKEIGIRKVVGAGVGSLLVLLCRNFIWLIVIANLLSWPVAFLIMRQWLQNFPYAVGLGWEVFVLTAFLALIIALGTVGYQALKAALANPVDSLRYE
jgi:putative ABC transport system permease protein